MIAVIKRIIRLSRRRRRRRRAVIKQAVRSGNSGRDKPRGSGVDWVMSQRALQVLSNHCTSTSHNRLTVMRDSPDLRYSRPLSFLLSSRKSPLHKRIQTDKRTGSAMYVCACGWVCRCSESRVLIRPRVIATPAVGRTCVAMCVTSYESPSQRRSAQLILRQRQPWPQLRQFGPHI